MGSYQPISRIAIVGAGPVGVAFAKYLLAEKVFERIDIFEQRDQVGGIWNYSSTERSQHIPIPQTDPRYGCRAENELGNDGLEFESPLYDELETNIPKHVMQYSDKPFAADLPLYPGHADVLQYLEEHADDVRDLIQFDTQVQDISLHEDSSPGHRLWNVSAKHLRTGEVKAQTYDAVVASSGHYTIPNVPDIKGVTRWNEAHPGLILHSKAYRRPEHFKGEKVLVIGNSASGLDIGMQIRRYCSDIYVAHRSVSDFGLTDVPGWHTIDEVVEFLDPTKYDRAIRTRSGTIVTELDRVIFATGYFFSFPYLSKLDPPLIVDGLRARDTYHHFLHIEYPELVLPILNIRIIPFPLAENQASVVARLWSGRLPMPSKAEMRQWEAAEIEQKGEGKHFHRRTYPDDNLQTNELYLWAKSASKAPGLENDGQGRFGLPANERAVWLRSKFIDIKMAYAAKGEDRKKIRTVEELGFVYEDWLKEATEDDRLKYQELFRKAKCPPSDGW